jgi:hypothetical protein
MKVERNWLGRTCSPTFRWSTAPASKIALGERGYSKPSVRREDDFSRLILFLQVRIPIERNILNLPINIVPGCTICLGFGILCYLNIPSMQVDVKHCCSIRVQNHRSPTANTRPDLRRFLPWVRIMSKQDHTWIVAKLKWPVRVPGVTSGRFSPL